jgi:hypothetical protein
MLTRDFGLGHLPLFGQSGNHLFPRPNNRIGRSANRSRRRQLESLEMRHGVILSRYRFDNETICPFGKRATKELMTSYAPRELANRPARPIMA